MKMYSALVVPRPLAHATYQLVLPGEPPVGTYASWIP